MQYFTAMKTDPKRGAVLGWFCSCVKVGSSAKHKLPDIRLPLASSHAVTDQHTSHTTSGLLEAPCKNHASQQPPPAQGRPQRCTCARRKCMQANSPTSAQGRPLRCACARRRTWGGWPSKRDAQTLCGVRRSRRSQQRSRACSVAPAWVPMMTFTGYINCMSLIEYYK